MTPSVAMLDNKTCWQWIIFTYCILQQLGHNIMRKNRRHGHRRRQSVIQESKCPQMQGSANILREALSRQEVRKIAKGSTQEKYIYAHAFTFTHIYSEHPRCLPLQDKSRWRQASLSLSIHQHSTTRVPKGLLGSDIGKACWDKRNH